MATSALLSMGVDEDELAWQAARAEALHVDGRFNSACSLWRSLAASNPFDWEAPLKAAASLISDGRHDEGDIQLAEARRRGAPDAETLYVKAQSELLRGNGTEAFELLSSADPTDPLSADCFNLLSMLVAQLRRYDDALNWLGKALTANPEHVLSQCNSVVLGQVSHARALLAEAARRAPERKEPLLIASRRNGRRMVSDALATAAGWRAPSPFSPTEEPPASKTIVTANARCGVTDRFILQIAWRIPAGDRRPPCFLLNRNMSAQGQGIVACDPVGGSSMKFATYTIADEVWQVDRNGAQIAFEIEAKENASEEWEGVNRWLPDAGAGFDAHWTIEFDQVGWTAFEARAPLRQRIPGLVAFRDPERLDGRLASAVGRLSASGMAPALMAVETGIALWQELLAEPLPQRPILAIVDRPGSTICYTRERFIRVPSGVALNSANLPILIHEAGHLWWGGKIAFSKDSLWLAEALAEYTLHLADSTGLIEGYRVNCRIAVVALCCDGKALKPNLPELARRSGRDEAHLLRALGGYAIANLAAVLGVEGFRAFLRALATRSRPIDAYDAFALASRIKGHSLNYFVHQWVTAERLATVELGGMVSGSSDCGDYRVQLVCRLRDATLPYVRFPIAVELADGSQIVTDCDLALGEDAWSINCPARPIRLIPDPLGTQPYVHDEPRLEFSNDVC